MKLSILIICWNGREELPACLRSIYAETRGLDFEVIVADNGSTDGSLDFVREHHPQVRIVENGANLGFARGNNAAIPAARGEYVLFLNPDTIIRDRALERWMEYVEAHPEAGAFGPRVLNPDGSFQLSARPNPTLRGYLISALYLRWLGRISDRFASDTYMGWDGTTEREVDWVMGCALLIRGDLLRRLRGFDDRFFFHFEDADLCFRVRKAGYPVLFHPGAEIIHLGGASARRIPVRIRLESYRNRYRYFFKHYGRRSLARIRAVSLLGLHLRRIGYALLYPFRPSEALANRLALYRVLIQWNSRLDPQQFIESGEEPHVGYEPLAEPPNMLEESSSVGIAHPAHPAQTGNEAG